jgi:sigma-B regulation protein RsbU (phosphoserine phosphatase)
MALVTNSLVSFLPDGGTLNMCQMWQTTNPEQLAPGAQFTGAQAEQGVDSCAHEQSEEVRALEEELAILRREQSKLYRGIFEAAQIQRRLCAPRQLSSGEFEVAGEIFPVRHLSGDFFKVMELDSALGIVVGDIAGKGLSAGIWLPHLVSLLHRCASAHPDPADAIAEANRELCAGYGEPPLVALFFARINLQDGEVVYCNAGLPSPLILGQNNDVARLEKGGPMLGAMSNGTFNTGSVTLDQGRMLIACSDGVTECQNSRDEEFDLRRLSAAARAAGGESASQTLFSALGAVLDFADGCPLSDDLTLLVVRRQQTMAIRDRSAARNSSTVMRGQVPIAPLRSARGQRVAS